MAGEKKKKGGTVRKKKKDAAAVVAAGAAADKPKKAGKKEKKEKKEKKAVAAASDAPLPAVPPSLGSMGKQGSLAALEALGADEGSENVLVATRIRPPNKRELARGAQVAVHSIAGNQVELRGLKESGVLKNAKKLYTFDASFPMDVTQEVVYQKTARGILARVLRGFNGTIFAYGQTGSGKTHTMQGQKGGQEGITPRLCRDLFKYIAANNHRINFEVEASYLELYNEQIRDLLSAPSKDSKAQLRIREDKVGGKGVYVENLHKRSVNCMDDIEELMDEGQERRTTGATEMNAVSSRSHAVFTIHLQQRNANDKTGFTTKSSKLHLVDLAGSERADNTKATGERLKEGALINKSLSALGHVINSLVKGAKHVPFRDSKLTRILQESLGGNAVTLLIAALSPADINAEETLSTLRFSDRAKCIKNKPVQNVDPKNRKIQELLAENKKLLARIKKMKAQGVGGGAVNVLESNEYKAAQSELATAREELRKEGEKHELHMGILLEAVESAEGMVDVKDREIKFLSQFIITNDLTPSATPEGQQLEKEKSEAEQRRRKAEAERRRMEEEERAKRLQMEREEALTMEGLRKQVEKLLAEKWEAQQRQEEMDLRLSELQEAVTAAEYQQQAEAARAGDLAVEVDMLRDQVRLAGGTLPAKAAGSGDGGGFGRDTSFEKNAAESGFTEAPASPVAPSEEAVASLKNEDEVVLQAVTSRWKVAMARASANSQVEELREENAQLRADVDKVQFSLSELEEKNTSLAIENGVLKDMVKKALAGGDDGGGFGVDTSFAKATADVPEEKKKGWFGRFKR